MRLTLRTRLDVRITGSLLCGVGLALLTVGSLLAAAIGIEALATAFWLWARVAADAEFQVTRWAWLRRPANALWLAVAIEAALPELSHAGTPGYGAAALLGWIEAIAVLWAGLELLAALPLARPYSDLPGPLLEVRPWLPVMLPAAGFAVLCRQAPHWVGIEPVRHAAVPILLLTAVLGSLRAFARRQWIASLRWLTVSDSALGAVLVATRAVDPRVAALLWLAACGGHGYLLAGELRGAMPRRGPIVTRMWRVASWTALASLSWPVLLAATNGLSGGLSILAYAAGATPIVLTTWITVGRMVQAPERRRVMRPDAVVTLTQATSLVVLAIGPIALLLAWWSGFEPSWRSSLMALAPAVIGGLIGEAGRRGVSPIANAVQAFGSVAPNLAGAAYRWVVGLERRVVGLIMGLLRAIASPLHDLHTGDAQEYLLFLIGIGVLALVLPLLQ